MSLLDLTPTQRVLQSEHIERRLRLASMAVQDRPINLRFKNGIDPSSIIKIPIKTVDEPLKNNNNIQIKELEAKIASLEVRLNEVTHRLNTGKSAIPDLLDTPEEPPVRYPSISEIQKIICARYLVTKNDICSRRHGKEINRVKNIGYYLCKKHTLRSYPEIGRMFGGKDHSCALRGNRKIAGLRLIDQKLDTELTEISAQIYALTAQQLT